MNAHDTRLDENGNVFTVEEMIEPAYTSLTDQLLAARRAWTREARANVKLKAKLKKEKKLFRQLWKGTQEMTAELDRKEAQLREEKTELDQKEAQLREAKTELEHIHIVSEWRGGQIRCLGAEVDELQDKNRQLVRHIEGLCVDWKANYYNELKKNRLLTEKVAQLESAMTKERDKNGIDWKANYYNEIKQSELLAEELNNTKLRLEVAQLEREATEMKPVPELDWEGNFNIERNRRELAEATVRSLRSKVARLEKDLKDSREDNVMFPKGTLVIFPAGSELRFL